MLEYEVTNRAGLIAAVRAAAQTTFEAAPPAENQYNGRRKNNNRHASLAYVQGAKHFAQFTRTEPRMRFGSVCSGIEAASVAWGPLGWEAAWLAEIEKFPSAVLAHHYPHVPNLGDMTALPERIACGEVEAPDVLCGGTPCQAFSVAGLRKSLDDVRGNLSLVFCEIANAIDAAHAVRGAPPRYYFLGKRPRRPQHQGQRLRLLSCRACRRG